MPRTRRVVAVGAAALGAVLMLPATASATGHPTPPSSAASVFLLPGALDGILLVGECRTASGEGLSQLKNIVALQQRDWMWAPLRLGDGSTLADLNKVLVPYSITGSGDGLGLKRRHLGPGESLARPGLVPPAKLVTCEFQGRSEDGEFQVIITGPVLPFPGRLIPVDFTQAR